MTSSIVPDAPFTDALSGADGTGDPPPIRWRPQSFADALVAPQLDGDTADDRPAVTVIPGPAPSPENWVGDLDLPTPAPSARSSAARAEAARQAAAARRDAARALSRTDSGSRPGARPATPSAAAPVQITVAATDYARPAAYRQPGYPQPTTQRQAGYARPTAFPQQVSAAHRPAPVPPAGRPVPPAGRPAPHLASPPRRQPTVGNQRKKSSGLWGALVFLIFLLVASGLGQRILDALSHLINR
jgi:hypothetical protein